MTRKNSTKKALIASVLSLALCFSMLVGTTFAWFTDSAVSSGNIIKTGTLDVEMSWANGTEDPTNATWTDASAGAIFDSDLWEPGYAAVRHVKIANEGTLALKYTVRIVANGDVSDLAEVIDVYYVEPAAQIADATALAADKKIGTLADVLAKLAETGNGELEAGEADTVTIALKMQETAGNEYQQKAIGTSFSIQVLATQLASEEDSFDNQYDVDATYPTLTSEAVEVDGAATAPAVLKADGIKVEVPVEVLNNLPAEVESIALAYTEPKVDANTNAVTFEAIELVDQNGDVIELEGNTEPITVTLPAQTAIGVGKNVVVLHDGVAVASTTVADGGVISYTANHFCEVTVFEAVKVDTADKLVAAVKAGGNVQLAADITIGSKLSITANTVIYGMGKTITYTGADRAIDVNNEGDVNLELNDLAIYCTAGYCERGINYNDSAKLTLNNVTVSGKNVNYAINLPGSSDNATVIVNDSTIIGNIALNVWGENTVIEANNTDFISNYESAVEACSVVKFNDDTISNSAKGTKATFNGGSIISKTKIVAVEVVAIDVELNISEETEVQGEILEPITIVLYEGQSQYYTTYSLERAIEKAIDNPKATIKLLKDIELDNAITVNGTVKLDLNGHNITYTVPAEEATYHAIIVKGDLTISGNGTITLIDNSGAAFNAGNQSTAISVQGGTLTLNEGVKVVSEAGAEMAYAVDVNTTLGESVLNINGAELNSSYIGVRIFNNNKTQKGIVNFNSGIINGEKKGYDLWAQNMSNPAENAVVNVAEGISYSSEALSGVMYYFD